MTIKKRKFEFPEREEFVTLEFGEESVDVKTYLDQDDIELLVGVYVDTYFGSGRFEGTSTDPLGASWIFDLALLDIATSIDVGLKKWNVKNSDGELENKILDYSYSSGLMEKIKDVIDNYDDVSTQTVLAVRAMNEERNSIPWLWSKIESLVNNEEKMSNMLSQFQELAKTIQDSNLSELVKEANK